MLLAEVRAGYYSAYAMLSAAAGPRRSLPLPLALIGPTAALYVVIPKGFLPQQTSRR
jgi:hypothetical protein